MRIPALCLFVVAALEAPAALAACEMPALVASIPDGTLATEEELLAVQNEVQAYVAAMDRYIACQNEEMTADEEDSTSDYLYLMTRRIEAAREEVDKVAADFNDQVNAFRAARQAAQIGR
ncbi:MAG: hypothetical protein PVH89_01175 [Gammaproteobacteria bacterium]|jgi:hypothetical protein